MSLSRYPAAPARIASNRSSRFSEEVRTTIAVRGERALIVAIAQIPAPAISGSIKQRFGSSRVAASIAS